MKKLLPLLTIVALTFSSCTVWDAATSGITVPGPRPTPVGTPFPSDPIVVNAEKTTHLSYDIIVACEKLEYENRNFVLANLPMVHKGVNELRLHSKQQLQTARALIAAYKLNRSPDNKFSMLTAVSVIQTAAEQAKKYMTQLQGGTP